MAASEHAPTESKSSITVATTAKGDPTIGVKIYDGADPAEIERLRDLAVDTYRQLHADLFGRAA